MRRRTVVAATAAAAGLLLSGHTPYGQWVVYRRKHLLIGCHKRDPETYRLARQVVASLAEHLPEASARPARAPSAGRLASLLNTDQIEVVVLSAEEARAMSAGTGDFQPYGPVPLRRLVDLETRLLLAHAGFPDRHARLVSDALQHAGTGVPAGAPDRAGIPWHPASAARPGE